MLNPEFNKERTYQWENINAKDPPNCSHIKMYFDV